eukprot:COSAG04_NODE_1278_length_7428_cov_25.792332_4_plen_327_part_00
MDAGAGPRGRLARLAAQLRPRPCAAQPIASSDAGAIEAYLREGAARARALGNRGPIRFDDEGRIAADILESYYEHGFYVCTNVVQGAELQALIAEFEAMLDNAPAGAEPWKSTNDRYGRPVRQPGAYALTKPLSDPFGATDFGVYDFDKGEAGVPRHPIKMSEPTASAEAPAAVVSSIVHPLLYLDGALHLYGHPQLLAMAEALNGPDFTPFTEASFHKPAGFGSSTAWHQGKCSSLCVFFRSLKDAAAQIRRARGMRTGRRGAWRSATAARPSTARSTSARRRTPSGFSQDHICTGGRISQRWRRRRAGRTGCRAPSPSCAGRAT